MSRIYNFSAGPATLPEVVLKQIQSELLNFQGSGISIMEMGHRRPEFKAVAKAAESDFRSLLKVPDNYAVLFLPGGARVQFAMLAHNLFAKKAQADYVATGFWSECAASEAAKIGNVKIIASTKASGFCSIPDPKTWQVREDSTYLHYTDNETLSGVEFYDIPDSHGLSLVSDMTSSLLSKPLDINKFGVIYAGAQKNCGIAGLAIVIVRKDLFPQICANTPSVFDYKLETEQQSLYSTPPTFPWYVSGLLFKWLKDQGGVEAFAKRSEQRAQRLYDVIDNHDCYINKIDKTCRSRMNVTFQLPNEALETLFLQQAEKQGLAYLKGHRHVGGIRASIYIGMPDAGVATLAEFMEDFAKRQA